MLHSQFSVGVRRRYTGTVYIKSLPCVEVAFYTMSCFSLLYNEPAAPQVHHGEMPDSKPPGLRCLWSGSIEPPHLLECMDVMAHCENSFYLPIFKYCWQPHPYMQGNTGILIHTYMQGNTGICSPCSIIFHCLWG